MPKQTVLSGISRQTGALFAFERRDRAVGNDCADIVVKIDAEMGGQHPVHPGPVSEGKVQAENFDMVAIMLRQQTAGEANEGRA